MALLDIPGYDNAPAYTGEYEVLPPGGYVCRIRNTKIETWPNNNGRSLVLALDICEGEKQGFFRRQYESDASPNKKWRGTFRQTIPKGDGTESDAKSLAWFKGMVTAIENSNPGFKWNKDTDTLKEKLIGCIFGREEYFNTQDGKYHWTTKVMFVRSAEKIRKGDFKIPDDKPAQEKNDVPPGTITQMVLDEDDLPF